MTRAADAARDARDWPRAAAAYAAVVAARPDDAAMHVQHGHALKEAGEANAAIAAYRTAASLRPDDAEVRMHLGDLLRRRGRANEAVLALAEALAIDPALRHARDVLLETGSRDLLAIDDPAAARALAGVMRSLDGSAAALARWERDAAQPPRDYAGFRADHPVRPPPAAPGALPRIAVRIDAQGSLAAALRATLLSLQDQTYAGWTATIAATTDMADHSVGSFAAQDDRIRFAESDRAGDKAQVQAGYVLLMDAGTILDPQALAWFAYVGATHAPALAYADHDAIALPATAPATRFSPRLYPCYDDVTFAAITEPPLTLLVEVGRAGAATGGEAERRALLAAAAAVAVAHVPRILGSRMILPAQILGGEDDLPPARPPSPPRAAVTPHETSRITVVIPTRDQPALLARAVETLTTRAARPGDLRFVVMDNRSGEAATERLFAGWHGRDDIQVIGFDEPFNWARANNLALAHAVGDTLVYANNDIEMLTDGWDDLLAAALAETDVGVVGARLLYPDRTIQHAGVLFGFGDGTPMHEGVGAPADTPGPLGRWRTRRAVAAVTGAFLAARRTTVERVGGFEARTMPIGYSDLDFCLKVREAGGTILYEPALTLIHHESVSRGLNDRRSRLAWDQGECRSFHERWGAWMFADPGYNPHWARSGTPFDGYREPGMSAIEAHIAMSMRIPPWRIDPAVERHDPDRR